MSIEVELKVHVTDVSNLQAWLDRHARLIRAFIKSDQYYGLAAAPHRTLFRLRQEGIEASNKAVCTYKDKAIEGLFERNREVEFGVDDPAAFHQFALALGYLPLIEKRKEGAAYRYGALTLELSMVADLGHFLELEYLLPDDADAAAVAMARVTIEATLAELALPADQIESRTYTQLLFARRGVAVGQ